MASWGGGPLTAQRVFLAGEARAAEIYSGAEANPVLGKQAICNSGSKPNS